MPTRLLLDKVFKPGFVSPRRLLHSLARKMEQGNLCREHSFHVLRTRPTVVASWAPAVALQSSSAYLMLRAWAEAGQFATAPVNFMVEAIGAKFSLVFIVEKAGLDGAFALVLRPAARVVKRLGEMNALCSSSDGHAFWMDMWNGDASPSFSNGDNVQLAVDCEVALRGAVSQHQRARWSHTCRTQEFVPASFPRSGATLTDAP